VIDAKGVYRVLKTLDGVGKLLGWSYWELSFDITSGGSARLDDVSRWISFAATVTTGFLAALPLTTVTLDFPPLALF
jgi:hypothetical protein